MITLVVGEVRMTGVATNPVLLLREVDGDRSLPVWVSATAAHAVLAASERGAAASLGPHDLLREVIAGLGSAVVEVAILTVDEGIFTAELRLDNGVSVGARVSDAVALAQRCGARIVAAEALMDEVAVTDEPVTGGELPLTTDDQLQRFRAFLDSISPDDFEAPGGNSDPDLET